MTEGLTSEDVASRYAFQFQRIDLQSAKFMRGGFELVLKATRQGLPGGDELAKAPEMKTGYRFVGKSVPAGDYALIKTIRRSDAQTTCHSYGASVFRVRAGNVNVLPGQDERTGYAVDGGSLEGLTAQLLSGHPSLVAPVAPAPALGEIAFDRPACSNAPGQSFVFNAAGVDSQTVVAPGGKRLVSSRSRPVVIDFIRITVDGADPRYPRELIEQSVQGTVTLRRTLDTAGGLAPPVLQQSSKSARLDELALQIVSQQDMDLRGGKPVEVSVVFLKDVPSRLSTKTCAELNADLEYFRATFPNENPRRWGAFMLVFLAANRMATQSMIQGTYLPPTLLGYAGNEAKIVQEAVARCAADPQLEFLDVVTGLVPRPRF